MVKRKCKYICYNAVGGVGANSGDTGVSLNGGGGSGNGFTPSAGNKFDFNFQEEVAKLNTRVQGLLFEPGQCTGTTYGTFTSWLGNDKPNA